MKWKPVRVDSVVGGQLAQDSVMIFANNQAKRSSLSLCAWKYRKELALSKGDAERTPAAQSGLRPSGEIGSHSGLKNCPGQGHVGSTPTSATIYCLPQDQCQDSPGWIHPVLDWSGNPGLKIQTWGTRHPGNSARSGEWSIQLLSSIPSFPALGQVRRWTAARMPRSSASPLRRPTAG